MSNYPSQTWDRPWSPIRPAPWIIEPGSPEVSMAQLRPQGDIYAEEYGAVCESMVVDASEVRFDASVYFCTVVDASWPSPA